jgi:uncharacterized protein YegJ (DUF2314 family)
LRHLAAELKFAVTTLSVLTDRLSVLAGTRQHNAFTSTLGQCKDAKKKCALLREQKEQHEASHHFWLPDAAYSMWSWFGVSTDSPGA